MDPAQVTFDYHSTRARKARLNGRLTKRLIFLMKLVFILLMAGGLMMVIGGVRLGGVLVAGSMVLLLGRLWQRGELSKLPSTLPPDGGKLILDESLSPELLAKLPDKPIAKDIWQAVKRHWQRQFYSARFGLDDGYFEQQLEASQINPDDVWNKALGFARAYGLDGITPAAVTVALFQLTPDHQNALNILNLEQKDVENGLAWLKHLEDLSVTAKQKEHYGGLGRDWSSGYTPLLNRLAYNISADVERQGLWTRETAGHQAVVNQILQILAGSRSSSVALVGELGVGKTTAVYALAKKLLTEKVPSLRYHQVFSIDASTLIANSQRVQSLEQLLLSIFGEAVQAKNIILFLDDAQLFMRAGTGSIDVTNILSQVLQSGRVHLICALTPQDWQLLTTNNSNLANQLNYQVMPPSAAEDSLQIMQDQLIMIEHKHGVVFTYQALREAYRLADKYLHDLAFPGRGIQLLEQAAVFAGKGLITPEIIGQSLESKLGVKVVQAGGAERQQLLNLEDELHKRLINQTRAVSVVSDALRRARSGVSNPDRPTGTFLFLGPTGVGKTELAKALADIYFGGREQIIRVNLNEYSRADDTSRLLAATTADTGSSFLSAIRRQPYSVVLLDEIEKAHPEVLNLLLQLLDEGVMKDVAGREASFKDSIVIATSNAGADTIRKQIEAGRDLPEFEEEFVNQLIDEKLFQPEFLNRFDEIVLFRPLKDDELQQVVKLMIGEVNQTLERQKVKVELSDEALAWLVTKGNDPRLGARPMRRMVSRSVENIVARKLLDGSAGPGSVITLDVHDLEAAG